MTLPGQITGVHTVGVPVTDQDRAIDFYVGTLGFDKRLDADMGGGRRRANITSHGSATRMPRHQTGKDPCCAAPGSNHGNATSPWS